MNHCWRFKAWCFNVVSGESQSKVLLGWGGPSTCLHYHSYPIPHIFFSCLLASPSPSPSPNVISSAPQRAFCRWPPYGRDTHQGRSVGRLSTHEHAWGSILEGGCVEAIDRYHLNDPTPVLNHARLAASVSRFDVADVDPLVQDSLQGELIYLFLS